MGKSPEKFEKRSMSAEVEELMIHLHTVRNLYQEQVAQDCIGLMPEGDFFSPEDVKSVAGRAMRQADQIAQLLIMAGDDERVNVFAAELNETYRELLGETVPTVGMSTKAKEAIDKLETGGDKYERLYKKQEQLEKKLFTIVETKDGEKKEALIGLFLDLVKERPKNEIIDKLFSGAPETRMEMLVLTMEYYFDSMDQVTSLPKRQRDEKLIQFEKSIMFYKHLASKEQRAEWVKALTAKAKSLQDGEGHNDKFRKAIWDTKNFIQDKANSALSLLLGGSEESMIVWMHEKAVSLERKLGEPILPNDPRVLKALQEELIGTLDKMGEGIDEALIDNAMSVCIKTRSYPSQTLTSSQRKEFLEGMKQFLNETILPTQKRIIDTHEEVMQSAYIHSHGTPSSFESDSRFRGIVGQFKGQDILRTLQVLSPFGMILPDKVELKSFEERLASFGSSMTKEQKAECWMLWSGSKDGSFSIDPVRGWNNFSANQKEYFFRNYKHGAVEDVKIKSYWDTGFWDEHELLSGAAQTSLGYLTVRGASPVVYHTVRGAGWITGATARKFIPFVKRLPRVLPKFLPKTMPLWAKGAGRFAGSALLGYELGDWINGKIMEDFDEDLQDDIKDAFMKHGPSENWDNDLVQDIRLRVLRGEIQKRRGYFQGVGVDVEDFGMGLWDEFSLGNLGGSGSIRDTMKETGELESAMITVNYQLNMLGLEVFMLD